MLQTSMTLFADLSDQDLLTEVSRLAMHERHATAALIRCLVEVDARRLPALLLHLEDGSITVTNARMLAPHLTDTNCAELTRSCFSGPIWSGSHRHSGADSVWTEFMCVRDARLTPLFLGHFTHGEQPSTTHAPRNLFHRLDIWLSSTAVPAGARAHTGARSSIERVAA